MVSLYITSLEPGDGKTTFSAGIARLLQDNNKKVGFLKPVLIGPDFPGNGYIDPDAAFFQKALSLEEPASSINIIAPADKMATALQKAASALEGKKDILIIEGLNIGGADPASNKLSADLALAVGAKVLLVSRYKKDLSVEKLIQAVSLVKDKLLGVVINAVPKSRLDKAKENLSAPMEKAGIKVLSLVTEDRVLFSVSLADLVEGLKGKVLINNDRLDEMVESFMLGAMTLESGKTYFSRKPNKVAIIRGERPDMMLAAMHTSTVGIISTGDAVPGDQVMLEAEVKRIPIIAVPQSTSEVASAVEAILSKARFRQAKKLERLADILPQSLDLKGLTKALNLN